jgi:predicted nucleotide-binding protein
LKKKASNSGEPEHQPNLLVSIADAQQKITQRIEMGHALIDRDVAAVESDSGLERARHEYEKWSDYNAELLRRLFDDQSIAKEYSSSWGAISIWERPLQEEGKELRDDIQEKIDKLEGISARLELYPELKGPRTVTADDTPPKAVGRKVFVVHGHDEAAKEKVSSLLRKLKLEPVILHEQASKGKTIIEKFEQYADVGFAVVLLTPDDVGSPIEERDQLKPRARQNVILELGFFLGKLGRSKVCALHKGQVEIPSDYEGVIYVPMDEAGAWGLKLGKELKEVGIEVDLNLLV